MRLFKWLTIPLLVSLVGCGQSESMLSFSKGQVQQALQSSKVTYYAAARFAEQAAFGPTPELIAELQAKGFEQWIDEQFALPASQIDWSAKENEMRDRSNMNNSYWGWYRAQFPHLAVGAADQLRVRVTWSLSQWIVVSDRRVNAPGVLEWMNLLQRVALSDYANILEQTSISHAMGMYLDNQQNRPKSEACPWCTPNENFARELMQLFSIGIVELNQDGSVKRDASGRPIETYTQGDVEELARALTGWENIQIESQRNKPQWDSNDWRNPMRASDWDAAHDWGAKRIMGNRLPSGQSPQRDLKAVVTMLMSHNNIAPFVSLRLIQNLVKSNPSPEYIRRVADVFVNNGNGARGDMKALVKAVLLDPEARRADDPRYAQVGDGKIREPFLQAVAVYRGLSCDRLPTNISGDANLHIDQMPFNPETVFGFYAPTDTASGTSILAPEQKLLNAQEFNHRLNYMNHMDWAPVMRDDEDGVQLSLSAAGCDVDALIAAKSKSTEAFFDFLSARYFRGAMPSTLKLEMQRVNSELANHNYLNELRKATSLLQYALVSPYYGASR